VNPLLQGHGDEQKQQVGNRLEDADHPPTAKGVVEPKHAPSLARIPGFSSPTTPLCGRSAST